MILQVKPNRWSCIATAFAMAMGMPVAEVFHLLGHDGSQILTTLLPEPQGRRGVHVQELIDVAFHRGFLASPYELVPSILHRVGLAPSGRLTTVVNKPQRWKTFESMVAGYEGVITGVGKVCHHAVAFARGRILDPDGFEYEFSFEECQSRGFFPQCIWLVTTNVSK